MTVDDEFAVAVLQALHINHLDVKSFSIRFECGEATTIKITRALFGVEKQVVERFRLAVAIPVK